MRWRIIRIRSELIGSVSMYFYSTPKASNLSLPRTKAALLDRTSCVTYHLSVQIRTTSPLPPHRRIEQPLPTHLIRPNRPLPFGRHQPIRKHFRKRKLRAAVFLRAEFDN